MENLQQISHTSPTAQFSFVVFHWICTECTAMFLHTSSTAPFHTSLHCVPCSVNYSAHTSPTELRFVESHWIEQQKIFLAQECNCEFLNFCPIFSAELNHCTALSFDIHLFSLLFFALHFFCTAHFLHCAIFSMQLNKLQ